MNKSLTSPILMALAALMVSHCASERAISGGPVDDVPPVVVYSSPENESIEVDQRTNITIRFSEQMDKLSVENALQVWPRPVDGYELKSSWTSVKVTFNQALEADETYLLTLDKSAKDLRGNGLESTYVLAFSTGEQMNRGKIHGRIFGSANIREQGNLFLYREMGTALRDLVTTPADYVFQPDDDGRFQLDYLNDQEYMLFYHWDRNRDRKINTGDYFGRPKTASVFARNDTLLQLQKIWPQVIPNDRVKLLEVSLLADSLAQIRTNLHYADETLDSLNIHREGEQVGILGASRVAGDEVAMLLSLSDDLVDGSQVWVTGFIDTSGYSLSSDTLQIDKQARVDSLQLSPFNISWLENDQVNFPEDPDEIIIRSNLPFTFESDTAFQVYTAGNDSVAIPGVLEVVSSMSWLFSPTEALGDGKTYKWQVQTEHIRSRYQQSELDSLWTGELQIISADSLGSIRLMHMGIHVLECTLSGGSGTRKFQLRPGTSLLVNDLPATSYQLIAYVDANGNGRYDSDQMTPVGGSEAFWVYPDPINVRARWETDIGIWRLRSDHD